MDDDKTEFAASSKMAAGADDQVNSTEAFPNLGKYQVKRILGEGAMGVVYEAFDPHIERTVALKTVRKNLLDNDTRDEVLARFKREAQSAGRLSHPGIVSVYEYDETADTGYIAMEYIQGEELSAIFSRGEKPRNEHVVDLVIQLLEALSFAHEKGIVHRDIKPSNIIITPQAKIKLTDFGIARVDSSSLTQAGSVLGTPAFMSPEQCIGGDVDARSDLFSVGAVMYYMLTGEKPFPGESAFTVIQRVIGNDPEPASRFNPMLSSSVDSILARAMQKKPENRYQTAQAFIDDLKSLGFSQDGHTGPNDSHDSSASMAVQQGNAGSRTGLIAGLVIAAVVVGGGAFWFLNQNQNLSGSALQGASSTPASSLASSPVSSPISEQAIIDQSTVSNRLTLDANEALNLDKMLDQQLDQQQDRQQNWQAAQLPAAKRSQTGLKLTTSRGNPPTYRAGETLNLSVRSKTAVYVYCFYRDAAANLVRIFPNDNTPDNFLGAGEALTLPAASDIYSIEFETPGTTEAVFCLSSIDEISPVAQSVSQPALSPLRMDMASIKREFENNASNSRVEFSQLTINISP